MSDEESFRHEDLKWKVDDIEMEGTITYPANGQSRAFLLLVAGSGPTDRDWCTPLLLGSNGSGKLLAEALSKSGYTCLRFDKRASGPNVMKNFPLFKGKVSMKFHLDELVGALNAAKERGFLKDQDLYALTNSEGAIHALNYQFGDFKPSFSGMILTGVPGRSIADVARQQVSMIAKHENDPEGIMRQYDEAMKTFAEGRAVNASISVPENVGNLIKAFSSPANLPFSRELWATDPAQFISRLEVPTLLMIGKKDLQVDWEIDGARLEELVKGKPNFKISYPKNSNHVLKYETKQKADITAEEFGRSYNAPELILDPEALSEITDWLDFQTHK